MNNLLFEDPIAPRQQVRIFQKQNITVHGSTTATTAHLSCCQYVAYRGTLKVDIKVPLVKCSPTKLRNKEPMSANHIRNSVCSPYGKITGITEGTQR